MKTDPLSAPTARVVHKRGMKKKANYLATLKSSGILVLDSTLEATTACALAVDPRVISFRVQPCTFDLNSGRAYETKASLLELCKGTRYKPKPYTPDFLVELKDKKYCFLEIKHSQWIKRNPACLTYPDLFFDFGERLIIISENGLRSPLDYNLRLLRPHIGEQSSDKTIRTLRQLPPGERMLGQFLSKYQLSQAEALRAVLNGWLSVELSRKRLGPRSLAAPTNQSFSHLEVLPL